MFDQLASLDSSRTTWRIKVRVTRMWPSVSSTADSKNALKGYNLILLDEDNQHIHAWVYAENWKSIEKDVQEGGLYIISNFYTREANGTLRPTSSKFVINFSSSTTVQKLVEEDFMIPNHKFEFVDLSGLFNLASTYVNVDSPDFSTDIIGVVENFEDVKLIQTTFGERNIVKFRITDGRYSHKVSVWGQLAVTTHERYHEIGDEMVIGIITSTKLKTWKTSVQISTLPSSKIYLNLDIEAVHSMKLRLDEEGYKPSQNSTSAPSPIPAASVVPTITVKELGEKTSMSDKKKLFCTKVKITSLEDAENWWYYSCSKCEEDVSKIEGKWYCDNCKQTIPVAEKRYKIVVLAGDSSEGFNFVLADKAAKRIVGHTAIKLIYDGIKNNQSDVFPSVIKDIVGKECNFTVEISDDNVLIQSKIFKVKDAHFSDNAASSTLEANIPFGSTSSIADNLIDLSKDADTPASVKSCAKKIKLEK